MRVAKITCVMADGSIVSPGVAYTRVVIRIALSSVALLALVIAPPPVINNSSTLTAAQTAAFRHFVGYGVLCLLPYLLDVAWMIWSPKRQTITTWPPGPSSCAPRWRSEPRRFRRCAPSARARRRRPRGRASRRPRRRPPGRAGIEGSKSTLVHRVADGARREGRIGQHECATLTDASRGVRRSRSCPHLGHDDLGDAVGERSRTSCRHRRGARRPRTAAAASTWGHEGARRRALDEAAGRAWPGRHRHPNGHEDVNSPRRGAPSRIGAEHLDVSPHEDVPSVT